MGDNLSEDNVFYLLDVVDKYDCKYVFHVYERLNYILIIVFNLFDISELAKICGSFLASTFAEMWEEDRARLLTLHPETWAGMLSNNELAIGYIVLPSLASSLPPPFLLPLPPSLFSLFVSLIFLTPTQPTTDLSRSCIIVSWHMQLNSKTIKHKRMRSLLSFCHVYDLTTFPLISWSTRESLFIVCV